MILEVSWDGLWTLSFGLSQFHGHSSWLVCEVALIALQALSLVENVEPVQVCCTLRLRDHRNKGMQDGCKVYVAYMDMCFMITWTIFTPSLGSRPSTKPRDHGTSKSHNCWFNIFIVCENPAWLGIHWNSIWLRARPHMNSHYTWEHVTTLHDFGSVVGQPLDTSFKLSQFHGHNYWFLALS